MRTFALHSLEGAVSGLVTAPDDAPVATLTPPPGLLFTEVEPAGDAAVAEPLDAEAFRALASGLAVAPSEHRATLVRRK